MACFFFQSYSGLFFFLGPLIQVSTTAGLMPAEGGGRKLDEIRRNETKKLSNGGPQLAQL